MASEKQTISGKNSPLSTAISQAQDIIEAAEQRAKQILVDTEVEIEELQVNVHYEQREKRKKDAYTESIRLIQDCTALGENLSKQAAELALAVAETIVRSHIETSPQTAVDIASDALREAVIGESVTVIVNPLDEKIIKKELPKLKKIANGASFEIETEDTISKGGVIVRTDFGEVDATIEVLIEGVKQRLKS